MDALQAKIDGLYAELAYNDELIDGLTSDSKAKSAELRKLEKLKNQLDEVLGEQTPVSAQ